MRINEETFNEIKKKLKNNRNTTLARYYGLSQGTISRINCSQDYTEYRRKCGAALKTLEKKPVYLNEKPVKKAKKVEITDETKTELILKLIELEVEGARQRQRIVDVILFLVAAAAVWFCIVK